MAQEIKHNTKVAICIPCYNEEKFIYTSVLSVLNQSYKNFTLHVIDNASTDKTLSIVKKIKDSRIIIHTNKKHVSMFENMNKCLSVGNYDYIKILCADDFLEKKCLMMQIKILEKLKNIGLVFNASSVINASGRKIFKRKLYSSDREIKRKSLIKKIITSGRNPIGESSCILFRKALIDKYKINYATTMPYSGDLDVIIRLLHHSDGYYLSEELSSFRVHKSAGSTKLIRNVMKEQIELLKKYQFEVKPSSLERCLFFLRLYIYYVAKIIIFSFYAK